MGLWFHELLGGRVSPAGAGRLGGMWALCWGLGPCSASEGAGLGQPGGERLWAPQVQQFHRAEQRLTPDEKTQAAAAEAEGVTD